MNPFTQTKLHPFSACVQEDIVFSLQPGVEVRAANPPVLRAAVLEVEVEVRGIGGGFVGDYELRKL